MRPANDPNRGSFETDTIDNPATEQAELIKTGKLWLRDSPTNPVQLAPTFLGATTPLPFVCAHCIGRLRGRGCYVEKFATRNVFAPDAAPAPCALCN